MNVCNSNDKDINDLVSQATEAILSTYEINGCKNIQDWEVSFTLNLIKIRVLKLNLKN